MKRTTTLLALLLAFMQVSYSQGKLNKAGKEILKQRIFKMDENSIKESITNLVPFEEGNDESDLLLAGYTIPQGVFMVRTDYLGAIKWKTEIPLNAITNGFSSVVKGNNNDFYLYPAILQGDLGSIYHLTEDGEVSLFCQLEDVSNLPQIQIKKMVFQNGKFWVAGTYLDIDVNQPELYFGVFDINGRKIHEDKLWNLSLKPNFWDIDLSYIEDENNMLLSFSMRIVNEENEVGGVKNIICKYNADDQTNIFKKVNKPLPDHLTISISQLFTSNNKLYTLGYSAHIGDGLTSIYLLGLDKNDGSILEIKNLELNVDENYFCDEITDTKLNNGKIAILYRERLKSDDEAKYIYKYAESELSTFDRFVNETSITEPNLFPEKICPLNMRTVYHGEEFIPVGRKSKSLFGILGPEYNDNDAPNIVKIANKDSYLGIRKKLILTISDLSGLHKTEGIIATYNLDNGENGSLSFTENNGLYEYEFPQMFTNGINGSVNITLKDVHNNTITETFDISWMEDTPKPELEINYVEEKTLKSNSTKIFIKAFAANGLKELFALFTDAEGNEQKADFKPTINKNIYSAKIPAYNKVGKRIISIVANDYSEVPNSSSADIELNYIDAHNNWFGNMNDQAVITIGKPSEYAAKTFGMLMDFKDEMVRVDTMMFYLAESSIVLGGEQLYLEVFQIRNGDINNRQRISAKNIKISDALEMTDIGTKVKLAVGNELPALKGEVLITFYTPLGGVFLKCAHAQPYSRIVRGSNYKFLQTIPVFGLHFTSYTPSPGSDFTSFTFPEQNLASNINAETSTIDINVPFGVDKSSLSPTFTTNGIPIVFHGAPYSDNPQYSNVNVQDYSSLNIYSIVGDDYKIKNWVVNVSNETQPSISSGDDWTIDCKRNEYKEVGFKVNNTGGSLLLDLGVKDVEVKETLELKEADNKENNTTLLDYVTGCGNLTSGYRVGRAFNPETNETIKEELIAEDFIIPDGQKWIVSEIHMPYYFDTRATLPAYMSVKVFEDKESLPGECIFEDAVPTPVDAITVTSLYDAVFKLTRTMELEGGKYWLSVCSAYENEVPGELSIPINPKRKRLGTVAAIYNEKDHLNEWVSYNTVFPKNTENNSIPFNLVGERKYVSKLLSPVEFKTVVNPDSQKKIKYMVNTNGLEAGTYNTSIIFKTNDPDNPNYTVPVKIIVSSEVGLNDTKKHDAFKCYPNPANNNINIQNTQEVEMVTIKTIQGIILRQIEVSGENTLSINISDLRSGMYFIELLTKYKTIETSKFVKK